MADKIYVVVEGSLKHENTNPVSIEVTKGQRGSYGWTIKVSGDDDDKVRERVEAIDARLRGDFPQPEGSKPDA